MQEQTDQPTPSRKSIFSNWWVQRLSMSAVILCAVSVYLGYERGWFRPSLPPFESIRKDDAPARKLVASYGLPELPDLTKIDENAAKYFYVTLDNVRRLPGLAEAYGKLARVYEAQGLDDAALTVYRRAIELGDGEDLYAWHYHAGLVAARLGRADEARGSLERALELKPDYTPVYMRLGDLALDAGDLDRAKKMFDEYVKRRSDDAAGSLALARLAGKRGDWQAVVNQVNAAREIGAIGGQGHELLSTAYAHLGSDEKAKEHKALAESAPGEVRIQDELEKLVLDLRTGPEMLKEELAVHLARGDFREAADVAERLVKKSEGGDPKELALAWNLLAQSRLMLKQYDAALTAVARALTYAPNEPEPHCTHGFIRIQIADYLNALGEAQRALELDANHPQARLLRGQALIALAPQDPRALAARNVTIAPAEMARVAVEDFQFVVTHDPTNLDAEQYLAWALGMAGRFDEAADIYGRLLALHPNAKQLAQLADAARAHDASGFWPATQPASGPAGRPAATQSAPG